jgi:hypothetical protein
VGWAVKGWGGGVGVGDTYGLERVCVCGGVLGVWVRGSGVVHVCADLGASLPTVRYKICGCTGWRAWGAASVRQW